MYERVLCALYIFQFTLSSNWIYCWNSLKSIQKHIQIYMRKTSGISSACSYFNFGTKMIVCSLPMNLKFPNLSVNGTHGPYIRARFRAIVSIWKIVQIKHTIPFVSHNAYFNHQHPITVRSLFTGPHLTRKDLGNIPIMVSKNFLGSD